MSTNFVRISKAKFHSQSYLPLQNFEAFFDKSSSCKINNLCDEIQNPISQFPLCLFFDTFSFFTAVFSCIEHMNWNVFQILFVFLFTFCKINSTRAADSVLEKRRRVGEALLISERLRLRKRNIITNVPKMHRRPIKGQWSEWFNLILVTLITIMWQHAYTGSNNSCLYMK